MVKQFKQKEHMMQLNLEQLRQRLVRDEAGITALETAIILIAFVVVASVFAFTILSAAHSRRSGEKRQCLRASLKCKVQWK